MHRDIAAVRDPFANPEVVCLMLFNAHCGVKDQPIETRSPWGNLRQTKKGCDCLESSSSEAAMVLLGITDGRQSLGNVGKGVLRCGVTQVHKALKVLRGMARQGHREICATPPAAPTTALQASLNLTSCLLQNDYQQSACTGEGLPYLACDAGPS